jgi:16S rRNA (guanine966-N2)-methyltransferase
MRVVAGSCRGRVLSAPPGRGTRPTGDRVREAVFNALESRRAVAGAAVLDLFAGSGALGIEALSRGADRATFVESDASARRTLRANIERCDLGARAEVVGGRAEAFLDGGPGPFDLALLDPPYAHDDGRWGDLLGRLPASTVVIESDRAVPLPPPWVEVRRKRYGGTVVLIACRPSG